MSKTVWKRQFSETVQIIFEKTRPERLRECVTLDRFGFCPRPSV